MKINLGAGNDIQDPNIYVNHDIIKHRPEIDVNFDLNDKNWSSSYQVHNFEEIRAWDVIEHLEDPINFMNNCWEMIAKDGVLKIKACGWKNPNFYVDITHKKPFDIKSFDYFDIETDIGKEYSYYTSKKWKIIEKGWDRKGNVIISLKPIK